MARAAQPQVLPVLAIHTSPSPIEHDNDGSKPGAPATEEVSESEADSEVEEMDKRVSVAVQKMGDNNLRRKSIATTIARRSRHDTTDESEEEEETTEEPQRAASVELGEPSPAQADTSATTSASSVFDPPETPLPSPPAANQSRKRKLPGDASPSNGHSNTAHKRRKNTTPPTSDGNAVLETPSKKSLAKKTYHSVTRSRLSSQNSAEPRGSSRHQLPTKSKNQSAEAEEDSEFNDSSATKHTCGTCLRVFKSTVQLASHQRTHRPNEDADTGATGPFTQREVNRLNEYRKRACEEYGVTIHEFNDLINWPKGSAWSNTNVTKDELLATFYQALPHRNRRSMRRYKERTFKNLSTDPHKWTTEQDRELVTLVKEHGQKWVNIAGQLGRTQDEVALHWFNKLKHQDSTTTGHWSLEEVKALMKAVTKHKRDIGVATTYDTDSEIVWSAISDSLNNTRTRVQCSLQYKRQKKLAFMKLDRKDKRRRTRAGMTQKEATLRDYEIGSDLDEEQDWADTSDDEPKIKRRETRRRAKAASAKKPRSQRSRKRSSAMSAEFVDESDSHDEPTGESHDDGYNDVEAAAVPLTEEEQEQDNGFVVQAEDNSTRRAEADLNTSGDEDEEDDDGNDTDIDEGTVSQNPIAKGVSQSTIPDESGSQFRSRMSNPLQAFARTPIRGALSRAFDATQANSSDIKTDKQRNVVEDTPLNPPKRPSPNVNISLRPDTLETEIFPEEDLSDDVNQSEQSIEEDSSETKSEFALSQSPAQHESSADEHGLEGTETNNHTPPPTFSSRAFQESSDEDEGVAEVVQDPAAGKTETESQFDIYEDTSVDQNSAHQEVEGDSSAAESDSSSSESFATPEAKNAKPNNIIDAQEHQNTPKTSQMEQAEVHLSPDDTTSSDGTDSSESSSDSSSDLKPIPNIETPPAPPATNVPSPSPTDHSTTTTSSGDSASSSGDGSRSQGLAQVETERDSKRQFSASAFSFFDSISETLSKLGKKQPPSKQQSQSQSQSYLFSRPHTLPVTTAMSQSTSSSGETTSSESSQESSRYVTDDDVVRKVE